MKTRFRNTSLVLLSLLSLCACSEKIIPDEHPYEFENPGKVRHAIDEGMELDGEFSEESWKNTRWLNGIDRLNNAQYAEINFTTFFSDLGVYFGLEVKEYGTTIYVNPERESYLNSCIEMYMGPSNQNYGNKSVFEMDFLADGSYSIRSQMNGWGKISVPDEYLPIVGSATIGGEINTESCTGYTFEIFLPFEFFGQFGYDIEHKEALEFGIDPVHIFSFTYSGKDLNEDRKWSWWSQQYISSSWLTPSSWFIFGKDGYCSYRYEVEYRGTGKGKVQETNGLEYIMKGQYGHFTITPINDATLKSLTFNGVDVTDKIDWKGSYGTVSLLFTEDSKIVAEFDA